MVAVRRKSRPQQSSLDYRKVALFLLLSIVVIQSFRLLWRLTIPTTTTKTTRQEKESVSHVLEKFKKIEGKLIKNSVLRRPDPNRADGQKTNEWSPEIDAVANNANPQEAGAAANGAEPNSQEEEEEHEQQQQERLFSENKNQDHNNNNNNNPSNANDNNNNKINNNINIVEFPKLGTGNAQFGYVVDFRHERLFPSFRNTNSAAKPSLNDKFYQTLETLAFQALAQNNNNNMSSSSSSSPNLPIRSCEQPPSTSNNNNTFYPFQDHAQCYEDANTTQFVAYNGANFDRYICGQILRPGQAILLKNDPNDCRLTYGTNRAPSIQFLPPDLPDISGHGRPPVTVLLDTSADEEHVPGKIDNLEFESVTCDVDCRWEKRALAKTRMIANYDQQLLPGNSAVVHLILQDTDWKITYTYSDPSVERHAQMERTAYKRNQYYATTSWKSSIPLSFFDFDKYNYRQAPSIDFDTAANAAANFANHDCADNAVRRQKYFDAAQAHIKNVHFYGDCHHTTDVPENMSLDNLQDRLALMRRDRVVLAYETSNEKWHVTPIVWEALLSGAVPAILGAVNLDSDILPPHAALYGSSYKSWDDFSQYIQQVADSKELWLSYQAWRNNETLLKNFEERMNFTRTSPHCRTCRWAYAKRYGLGWNAQQQMIQESHISKRQFCVDSQSTQWVTQPFLESWYDDSHEPVNSDSQSTLSQSASACQEKFVHSSMKDTLGLERTVWYHDGLTDMNIFFFPNSSDNAPSKSSSVTLLIQVPIRNNNEGAIFRHVHTLVPDALRSPWISSVAIQDQQSKVTILANFIVLDLRSPAEGILEVVIPRPHFSDQSSSAAGKPRQPKLRIITEDFDDLHDKLTEYFPSSYAVVAMKDFMDPLDLFFVMP